jgi:pimeloyl-ACP methyl ester carboxylesterase
MLHGWGLDGRAYRAALHGFARAGWQVYAPTANVAMGQRWSLGGLARRVEAISNALGVPPCSVVGHSFGGVIAARLALDFPRRVRSLVAVNSALVSPGGWKLCRLGLPGGHYRLAVDRRVISAFARAQCTPGALAHLAGSIRWMLSTDLAPELPRIRERSLPAAVLWAIDTCLPEALGQRAAELMGASFHPIAREAGAEEGDHLWPLRNPEMFVDRVVHALDGLVGAPRRSQPATA